LGQPDKGVTFPTVQTPGKTGQFGDDFRLTTEFYPGGTENAPTAPSKTSSAKTSISGRLATTAAKRSAGGGTSVVNYSQGR